MTAACSGGANMVLNFAELFVLHARSRRHLAQCDSTKVPLRLSKAVLFGTDNYSGAYQVSSALLLLTLGALARVQSPRSGQLNHVLAVPQHEAPSTCSLLLRVIILSTSST
jgi:hypothetical protein